MDTQNPIPGETRYLATSDERTLAILSHILTLVGGVFAPLIIYLIKKDESAYVTEHAKESLNFQITMMIGFFVSFILMFIIIGIFLMVALGILYLVCVIVASVKAGDNKMYRYPFCLRLIK